MLLSTPSLGITSSSELVGVDSRTTSFQLPLSGSRCHERPGQVPGGGFQLPLSGSLSVEECSDMVECKRLTFQLPLSGSPAGGAATLPCPSRTSFQLPLSGSRNGGGRRKDDHRENFQLPLSGSLTSSSTAGASLGFQLPLSGSLAHLEGCNRCRRLNNFFQLPLSGSQSSEAAAASPRQWSFNSLSRDHVRSKIAVIFRLLVAFNSLSRDHSASCRGLRRSRKQSLSTPSLGITWYCCGEGRERGKSLLSTPSLGITGQVMRVMGFMGHEVGLSTPSLGITGR